MLVLNSLLLQASPSGGVGNIVMIVLMIAVFYFFMIRPQQQKQKKQIEFTSNLKRGSNVVTSGGICGTVLEITPVHVTIEVDKGVKLKMLKSSISLDNTEAIASTEKATV